jgi:hypothetical protein
MAVGPGEVDLERGLSEVARSLFAAGSVEATLQQIVRLAEQSIDGCDGAGVFLIDLRGSPSTAAASGELVTLVDDLQIEAGEGPCLDAARQASTFYAQDLAEEPRWPAFADRATATGVRSVLSYSLSTGGLGALNLYGRLPVAFGATDRAQGHLFATLANLALESATERAAEASRADHLVEALNTREMIGQAQGILMERERITSEQAFDVLRRASQHLNVKLREVAETLVDTGEAPPTGHPLTSD